MNHCEYLNLLGKSSLSPLNSSSRASCKIYVSDEGYGPLVRQSAIISSIRRFSNQIDFTLQTERFAESVPRLIDNIEVSSVYNNISWAKQADGAPAIEEIRAIFADYPERANAYVERECSSVKADFILSDFVYEAFPVAARLGIPAFGVAHFTWDWFFCKLFPPVINDRVLEWFFACAEQAEVLYFPPFTPGEIMSHYAHKARRVPLIVREMRSVNNVQPNDRFKVLIMDSGSGLLAPHIYRALSRVHLLPDFQFYISSRFQCEADNVTNIDPNELFSDYIPHMDLVICRAGFNTISECIAYRTPFLLIGEAVNPEMSENMLNLKKAQLGSLVALESFANELHEFLPRFVDHEYRHILHMMNEHAVEHNGADIIAQDILNRVGEV
ncbi:MAG: glycosyltransferase [Verrucomicrobia bacterium]|nr:glycosyltransferase [Verrucomicrobiota bacterium]